MTHWSNERTINFIHCVRIKPVLWDIYADVYRDRNTKKRVWAEIAHGFDITPSEAQQKFKNLRTYFQNEKRKLQKNNGNSKYTESIWFAFKEMDFLSSNEATDSGMDINARGGQLSTIDEFEVENSVIDEPEEIETDNIDISVDTPPPIKIAKNTKKRKHQKRRNKLFADFPTPTSKVHKKVRIHNAFGEHVSQKLESYSSFVRSQVEYKISQILFDADMGHFSMEANSYSTSVLNSVTAHQANNFVNTDSLEIDEKPIYLDN